MDQLSDTRAWIERLVAHDTTSRHSNLNLIEDVDSVLKAKGVATYRTTNAAGDKANLFALIGPEVPGGVVLSAHTDVVPVDGQDWSSDPWRVEERDGKLFGRGVADMKSFPAIALAHLDAMLEADLKRPIILALSYDEEVGCLGAPSMIAEIVETFPAPAAVIVGEPTSMQVVDGHKGIAAFRTDIRGHEAHSSQTGRGASAVMAAGRLIAVLAEMTREGEAAADPQSPFEPPHATMTANLIEGGSAVNIMAGACSFTWDMRAPPGADRAALLAQFEDAARAIEAEMRMISPDCAIETTRLADAPPLEPQTPNPAAELAERLTGANRRSVVAYAAEAGQFQAAGLATAICGPGSIDQAHAPDEFITLDQVAQGVRFMQRLIEELSN
ncbi:MAG: acetylornithine deacetylase [Pseudomonadota bacterium]